MYEADGDFVMASDQKPAHIENHSEGKHQAVWSYIQC